MNNLKKAADATAKTAAVVEEKSKVVKEDAKDLKKDIEAAVTAVQDNFESIEKDRATIL